MIGHQPNLAENVFRRKVFSEIVGTKSAWTVKRERMSSSALEDDDYLHRRPLQHNQRRRCRRQRRRRCRRQRRRRTTNLIMHGNNVANNGQTA